MSSNHVLFTLSILLLFCEGLFAFQFSTQFTRNQVVWSDRVSQFVNNTEKLSLVTFNYSNTKNTITWESIYSKGVTQFETANDTLTFSHFRFIHKNLLKSGDNLFIPGPEIFDYKAKRNDDGLDLSFDKLYLNLYSSEVTSSSDLLDIPELFKNNYYMQWFTLQLNISHLRIELPLLVNFTTSNHVDDYIVKLLNEIKDSNYTYSSLALMNSSLLVKELRTSSEPVTNICSSTSPVIAFAWNSWKLWFVIVLLLIMLVLLILSVWRPYVVIIGVVVIFNLAGVLTLDQTLAGFANSGTLVIALLFPIVKPLTQNSLVLKFSKFLFGSPIQFKNMEKSKILQHISLLVPTLRMCLVFTLIGAFVNNTPVVVLGLPIVMEWARQHNVSPSKFLMALSFITSGSGFLTSIGNSSNIVASGIYANYGYTPLTFYEFFYLGIILNIITIVYLITYGLWIVPNEIKGESKKVKRATVKFAKKANKLLNNSKNRFEEFLAVIRMNELSTQDIHTKPYVLFKSLLGGNSVKIIKSLDLDDIELVEIIRKNERKVEEKPVIEEKSIELEQTTEQLPTAGNDSPKTSDSSIEIDMTRVKQGVTYINNETKRIKPIPEDLLIEKDDILIFKGNAKSILKLQAMAFEVEEYEDLVPKQTSPLPLQTEDGSVMKNSPSQLSLISNSSQDELIPQNGRVDSPVGSVGGYQTDIISKLHANLKKNHESVTAKNENQQEQVSDLKQFEYFEVVIGASNPCVGETYADFEKRYQVTVLAIRNMFYDEKSSLNSDQDLRNFQVFTGDTILILGKTRFYMNYHNVTREFYMISRFSEVSPLDNQFNQRPFQLRIPFTNKVYRLWWWEHWIFLFFPAMIACTIAGFSMVQCSLVTFCVVIAFGLISPTDAIESVDWALVALVGASFGIGSAITQSGVGQGITQVLKIANIPTILLPAFITAITLVVANVITSSAVVAICIPIAVSIAQAYGLNARCFAMCVIYASQSVFTLPLGFSGNLLVMGVGNYKFLDFAKAGLPLTIIYWIVISVLVPAIWGLDTPNF